MRGFLSLVAMVCLAAFAGLSVLPDSVHRLHPTGLGGTDMVLVPYGDDNSGGH